MAGGPFGGYRPATLGPMATDPSSITPAGSAAEGGPLAEVPTWLRPVAPVVVMLAIMWVVEVIDIPLRGRLDRFGVHPRELAGLPGIVFAPFLHAGFGHLIANTLPFLVLGAVVAYAGLRQFILVTAIVMAGSGLGMWLFGTSNSVQIGASGLVFGYFPHPHPPEQLAPDSYIKWPLILDGDDRLYLHRHFDYERRLAQLLMRARCAS